MPVKLTLDSTDSSDAEDTARTLNPLKKATAVLCDVKYPTASLIMPLKHKIDQ